MKDARTGVPRASWALRFAVTGVHAGGLLLPYTQGRAFPMSGGFLLTVAELASTEAGGALKLLLQDEVSRAPVETASVVVRTSMPFMGHEGPTLKAQRVGSGYYSLLLGNTMVGEWELRIEVREGPRQGSLAFAVQAFPGL